MEKVREVVWWKRLLLAFAAMFFTLVLTTALYTARDFQREPDLHWLNGGEIQIAGLLLLAGGCILLATFVFFVAPLILLWPFDSQRRHWYAMLAVSTIWPPTLELMIDWHAGLFHELEQMRRFPALYGWLELIALCACGTYLLMIRRHRHPRLT